MSHKLLLTVVLELDVPVGTTPKQIYSVSEAAQQGAIGAADSIFPAELYANSIECDCGNCDMDEDVEAQTVTCSECEVFS